MEKQSKKDLIIVNLVLKKFNLLRKDNNMRDKECRIMMMRLVLELQKKGIIKEEDLKKIFGEPTVIKMKKPEVRI